MRNAALKDIALIALGFWILASPKLFAEKDDPNALNQQVYQLIEQGKYQEAIPIAERAVEVARRVRAPEDLDRATSLNNLALLYRATGEHVKAEPLLQEALRIRQKVLGPENPNTAASLNELAALYEVMGEYAKAEPLHQEALRP
jgi:tetratricopeptide (TPR) repeat protein